MVEPNAGRSCVRPCVRGVGIPADADALRAAVDVYLAGVQPIGDRVRAVVSPHAGLMYSGAIAGQGLRSGVTPALRRRGPRGPVALPSVRRCGGLGARQLRHAAGGAYGRRGARRRPARGGAAGPREPARSTNASIRSNCSCRFSRGSSRTCPSCRCSSDISMPPPWRPWATRWRRCCTDASRCSSQAATLSHYQDRETAARLDAVVIRHVERNDPEGLQASLAADPSHACGGGPMVAVMRAARGLGANACARPPLR